MAAKKPERVVQLYDGVWYRLAHGKPPYHHSCCRCGLTHEVEFKYEQGSVWERWTVLPDPPKAKVKRGRRSASPFTDGPKAKNARR